MIDKDSRNLCIIHTSLGEKLKEFECCFRRASLKHRGHYSPSSLRGHNVHSLITADHTLRDLSNQARQEGLLIWLAALLLRLGPIHSLLPFLQSFVFHDLHHEMVLCVAFSHDGEEVVAGGMSGHVKVSSACESRTNPF